MTCKQIEDLLGALCDGSLDAEQVRAIEAHLDSCANCREEKARVAMTLEALRTFERIEPSEDFAVRLWEKIDQWEAVREAYWVTTVAAFIRRNRRAIVACCMVFAVSLLTSVFMLHRVTHDTAFEIAEETAAEGFVIREIPLPATTADTVYIHFVTGDRPAQRYGQAETYVSRPVVKPVSDVGPAF